MKNKLIVSIYMVAMCFYQVVSQAPPSYNATASSLIGILDSAKHDKFFYLNFEYSKSADSFFLDYKSHFGFNSLDSFGVIRKITDEYGITHTYFNQYYKKIVLYGSDIHLQTRPGSKTYLNGSFYPISSLNDTILISDSQAIAIAKASFNFNTAYNGNSNITPTPITCEKVTIHSEQGYIVAYIVNLDLENDKYSNMDVYINAKTGNVIIG